MQKFKEGDKVWALLVCSDPQDENLTVYAKEVIINEYIARDNLYECNDSSLIILPENLYDSKKDMLDALIKHLEEIKNE